MRAARPFSKPSSLWLLAGRFAGALLCLLLAAPIAGCKRNTGPSAHYDRGASIHQQLWVRLLDDAYLDPRMEEAVRELKLVENTSLSYQNALDLLAQIEKGRKETAAARDARAKAFAEMEKGTRAPVVNLPPPAAEPPPPPPPPAPAAPVQPDPFGPGALIADINNLTGGCLAPSAPFREDGEGGKSGQAYKLAPSELCKEKLPGFAGQVVLAVDGKVYRRIGASEVRVDEAKKAAPASAAPAKAEAVPAAPPPRPGTRAPLTDGPPAYEGQKDAPKLVETQPGKVEDSTPRPAQ